MPGIMITFLITGLIRRLPGSMISHWNEAVAINQDFRPTAARDAADQWRSLCSITDGSSQPSPVQYSHPQLTAQFFLRRESLPVQELGCAWLRDTQPRLVH